MTTIEAAKIATEALCIFAQDYDLSIHLGTVQYSSSFKHIVWRFDIDHIDPQDAASAGKLWSTYGHTHRVPDCGQYTHEGIISTTVSDEELGDIAIEVIMSHVLKPNFPR